MNQVISLTSLRLRPGQIVEEANKGKTFLVSDKGEIKAMVGPVAKSTTVSREEVFERMKRLQERADRESKGKKGFDSTKIVRKMRDEREKKLRSYL